MQTTSLMDLKTNTTPQEFAQALRNKGEIFWSEPEKFWVVTSYEYAKQLLVSEDFTCDRSPFFISSFSHLDISLIKDFFAVVSKMMVMSDPPEHTARRRICYDGFTNQTLQNLQPLILKTVDQQLSKFESAKQIELVEDLAKIIPSAVLADFFHIPESERQHFYEWSNNMTQFFGGSSQPTVENAKEANYSASQLHDYFTNLMQQRRKQPLDDFLSILLKNHQAFQLTDDEIISQAIMMLVAGQVSTTDQLCNNIYTLLTSKDALKTIQSKNININDAIEELNRLDPAVSFVFRLAKHDTSIGNQAIKAGDVIFISAHAVNRDPQAFAEPDVCNLTRTKNKHLSYGFGPHYCVGSKLAQLEMQSCFTQLLQRFPNLRLAENDLPKRKHQSLSFTGFERLPLQFD